MGRLNLNSKEKVLLHLHRTRVSSERREYPIEVTQEGIADATGMRKTHVPRTVKGLEKDGLVESKKGYIRARERKLKVYIITAKGEERVSDIEGRLFRQEVTVVGKGEPRKVSVEEILKDESRYGIDLLDILDAVDGEGAVDVSKLRFGKGRVQMHRFNVPSPGAFHGRENEMDTLMSWLGGESPILVITGQVGMGKTSLAAKMCEMVEGRSVFWFSIPRDRQLESLYRTLDHFMERLGMDASVDSFEDVVTLVAEKPLLLVIDGYYEVEEEFVDLMVELVRGLRKGATGKLLVTSPTGTPSYSRFYTLSEIESGKVRQMMLGGVSDEAARSILGADPGPENMRKIYLLTKHNPSWLMMMRNGDEEGLLNRTRLTREEIRLLFFWMREPANTKH